MLSFDATVATSNEHPAKVMTFMVVFVSVFCGWPCLLHCMAGFAKTGTRGRQHRVIYTRSSSLKLEPLADLSLALGIAQEEGGHISVDLSLCVLHTS